jgi:phosphocarrier protein
MRTKELIVIDPQGMHARPATVVVTEASKFSSNCEVEFEGRKVNLKSIMGVMSLGMMKDAKFTLFVEGEDQDEAFTSILNKLEVEGVAK